MDADARIYDGAAQLERTALSWNRTLLAFAANGVLLLGVGHASGTWTVVVGTVLLIMTLLAWLISGRTYRTLRHRPQQAAQRLGYRLHVVTWVAFAVGIADVLAILTYR